MNHIPRFAIKGDQLTIGEREVPVTLTTYANSQIYGKVAINQCVNVDQASLTLTEQTAQQQSIFSIRDQTQQAKLLAEAGRLAINTGFKQGYQFSLAGQAYIEGGLTIQGQAAEGVEQGQPECFG